MSQAQGLAEPQPPAPKDRFAWWRDARFGMFIHWGLYAIPAGVWNGQPIAGIGEWIMNRARIPVREYEQLAARFNPVKFDARAWVRVAKDAGMRYIVITSKHHDGFAIYDSPASTYDIADATPFGRDPLRELAKACQAEGLRLCFYYSQAQDWHHPDAAGNDWDYDPARQDFARYFEEKCKPQVREILTQYGPIGLIWFDTPRVITSAQSAELTALVHALQPACLVNSRVGHGAGDYESAGDNQIPVYVKRTPWETPATLNDTWGFKTGDHNWKPTRTLLRLLCDIVGKGGNYLLNVGPTAEGEIPAPSVERLRVVGAWMRANGEAIYGCGPGPFPVAPEWGAITARPGKLYLHVFDWRGGEFAVRGLAGIVRGARLLAADRTAVAARITRDPVLGVSVLRLDLPPQAPDPDVSVIAVDVDGAAEADPRPLQAPSGAVMLEACQADRPADLRLDAVGLLGGWSTPGARLAWTFGLSEPGEFDVEVWTQAPRRTPWQGGQSLRLAAGGHELRAALAEDERRTDPVSPHQRYAVTRVGRIALPAAGWHALTLEADGGPAEATPPLLRAVRLVPTARG